MIRLSQKDSSNVIDDTLCEVYMKNLLKESFDLFCKNNWLKTIDRECDKYNKLKSKLNRQQYVVNALAERYKELYGEDLRNGDKY